MNKNIYTIIHNIYVKVTDTLLFFISENIIPSGSYDFGSNDQNIIFIGNNPPIQGF